jgi:hypothetical protein
MLLKLALSAAIALSTTAATAQDRTYNLGPVVAVSHMKVEPGQLNAYMSNLNNLRRKSLEDGKRRGEVLSYGVYQNMAPGANDADLMLVVTYKNAAVMDTSLNELDRRTTTMQGSLSAAQQATIARGKMRTVMGSQLLRELKFK